MSAEERRKLATDTSFDGSRFFLELPREILIDEICSFLSTRDIGVFLGQTCQAIRRVHYKITSVFTPDRPLKVTICSETEDFWARGVPSEYLLRQARIRSEVIPVDAELVIGSDPLDSKWRLSDFKYTICRFAASDISLRALVHFLSQHPEFGSVSVLDFREIDTSEAPQDPHMALDLTTQIAFPAVRLVTLNQGMIVGYQALSLRFPRAIFRIRFVWFGRYDQTIQMCVRERFANVQIDTLDITQAYTEKHELYRWCIQRTISALRVDTDIPSKLADLLTSELKSRSAISLHCAVYIRHSHTGAPLPLVCPAYAKYVTSVTLPYRGRSDLTEYYLKSMHGFVSVKRLKVCFGPRGPIRLSLAGPDDVIVINVEEDDYTMGSSAIDIVSSTPLRLADMEYIVVSIYGMTQIQYTDAVECDIAQQVAAIRQRLPQTHDPAWRLMYKFHSSDDPNAVPIEGYV